MTINSNSMTLRMFYIRFQHGKGSLFFVNRNGYNGYTESVHMLFLGLRGVRHDDYTYVFLTILFVEDNRCHDYVLTGIIKLTVVNSSIDIVIGSFEFHLRLHLELKTSLYVYFQSLNTCI